MPIFVGAAVSTFLSAGGAKGVGVGIGTTTTTGRNAGVGTATGTIIYNITDGQIQVFNGPSGWSNVNSATGPSDPADYPISPSLNQIFTTPWTGSPPNLPTSDTNSTWIAPSTATRARVIVVGAGGGAPGSYGRGRGAVVDALIEIIPNKAYKVIVGEKGADTSNSGTGGHGCGGGPGVDDNDTGSGSGGSAFFYADPSATSDPVMFPRGVLIAGAGGGGNSATHAGSAPAGPSPDPIGGYGGISRKGGEGSETGEPGGVGGIGGRIRHNNQSLLGPNAARGSGGSQVNDGYPGCNAGTGGGAGAGGYGGDCNPGTNPNTAENAPNGRGRGYNNFNTSGAGRGGDYPMRGGNGFTFNGVNLGGGGGGSHGRSYGSGGWGGGGGAYYLDAGGSGGSGAWGYVAGTVTITPLPSSGPPAISIRGGTLGVNTPFPSTAGLENTDGAIIIMWDQ